MRNPAPLSFQQNRTEEKMITLSFRGVGYKLEEVEPK